MNLVTIIENIEIERSNNRQLGNAVEARLLTLKHTTEAMISQGEAFVSQLRDQKAQIEKAMLATAQEIDARDEALSALIGGGE